MGIATDRLQRHVADLSYEFYDLPRFEPLEAYDDARETFVDRLSGVDGVVSVYESGDGPGVPGISDVDMVVVVEDDHDDPERLRERIEAAKVDEYFFFHGPDVVPESTFSDYYSVLPVPKDMHLHYGADLEYEKNESEYNRLAYLIDSFNDTYPREFLEFLFFPGVLLSDRQYDIAANDMIDLFVPRVIADRLPIHVETRLAIHRLNSLRNDMALFCETADVSSDVLTQFDESITDLRSRWFDEPKSRQETLLLDRLADAVTACFEFADLVREYAATEGIAPSTGDETTENVNVYVNSYHADWSADAGERVTVDRFRYGRIKSLCLPSEFRVNRLSRQNDPRVPTAYADAVRRRDETAKERLQALSTYRFHPLRDTYMSIIERLNRAKAWYVL